MPLLLRGQKPVSFYVASLFEFKDVFNLAKMRLNLTVEYNATDIEYCLIINSFY